MILVRDIFQCKFGTTGDLVRRLKETGLPPGGGRRRVLTDLSGPFHTVVVETVVESIDAYHRRLQEQLADPAFREQAAGMAERIASGRIASGRREYFTIELEG
jgi:hypothetical protein